VTPSPELRAGQQQRNRLLDPGEGGHLGDTARMMTKQVPGPRLTTLPISAREAGSSARASRWASSRIAGPKRQQARGGSAGSRLGSSSRERVPRSLARFGSHEWDRGGVSALSNQEQNLRDDASLTIYVKKVTGDWHARDLGCEVSHPTIGTHHFEINLVHVQNATSRAHSVAIESRDLVVRIAGWNDVKLQRASDRLHRWKASLAAPRCPRWLSRKAAGIGGGAPLAGALVSGGRLGWAL
jgi:hypothetical protein